MRFVGLVTAALVVGLSAGTARAALIYTLPAGPITVRAGQTVNIPVFLTETAGTTFLTSGLLTAGVELTGPIPGGVAAVTAITPNPAFGAFAQTYPAGDPALSVNGVGGLFESVGFGSPVLPTGNQVLVGTFTLTGVGAGTFSLRANPLPDPTGFSFGSSVNGNGVDLDAPTAFGGGGATAGPAVTVTVTTTPVPATAGVLGLSAAGLAVARRLRRRA